MQNTEPRQHAHAIIDVMKPEQIAALVPLLEVMLDPFERSLANAPTDDEPTSEEEERAAAESILWLETHEPISNREVLAEYGLTEEDFDRMGRVPLENGQEVSS